MLNEVQNVQKWNCPELRLESRSLST
jgi:hypothetical protein